MGRWGIWYGCSAICVMIVRALAHSIMWAVLWCHCVCSPKTPGTPYGRSAHALAESFDDPEQRAIIGDAFAAMERMECTVNDVRFPIEVVHVFSAPCEKASNVLVCIHVQAQRLPSYPVERTPPRIVFGALHV
jgi:hypothetical protein